MKSVDSVNLSSQSNNYIKTVCLSLLVSLFGVVMFAIPLQITTSKDVWIITGYDVFLEWNEVSGWWGEGSIAILSLNILMASVALVMVICNVYWLIKKSYSRKVAILFDVLIILFAHLYFVEGILLVLLCSWKYSPTTFSFFAPILAIILIAAKHILTKVWRTGNDKRPQSIATDNVKDIAEQLRQYKILLDEGVISQEEYDAKKKHILDL